MPSCFRNITFLLLLAVVLIACQNSIDLDKEKEKIQEQIDRISDAHFDKDATKFYAPYDDYWYDAREGLLREMRKSDELESTQAYLDGMEFLSMDNTQAPVIEISDDGTMASYMGAVVLKGKFKGDPVFWVVSWQSVFKKIHGEWKIISSANTQAPFQANAPVILEKAREALGTLSEDRSLYAMADCKGPDGAFKTLLLSGKSDARMEQIYAKDHIVLKIGDTSSWMYNLNTNTMNDAPGDLTKMFVQGHELHWLSFRPEDRFQSPIFKGFESFNDTTSFKIEMKDALNRPVYFYYSFDNYRPLGFKISSNREDEMVSVYFSDWRKVEDLHVFYKATFADGANLFQYDFTEIRFDTLGRHDFENKETLILSDS